MQDAFPWQVCHGALIQEGIKVGIEHHEQRPTDLTGGYGAMRLCLSHDAEVLISSFAEGANTLWIKPPGSLETDELEQKQGSAQAH